MISVRLYILIPLTFAVSILASAQNDVNLDQGLKPYGSYLGGNIDTVSLTNGNLMLHIPLVSYPQRGGRLSLAFYLRYNNKGFNGFDQIGVDVQRDQLVETRTHTSTFSVPGDNGTAQVVVNTTSVTTPDGSSHDVSWRKGSRSVNVGPIDGSALGQHGVKHFLDTATSIPVDPSCTNAPISFWNPVVSQDPNGNQIVTSPFGWTDTMGRVIPGQALCPTTFTNANSERGIHAGGDTNNHEVRMLPGASTTDLSGCPANTSSARIWVLPAFANSSSPSSTSTATMKFCYAPYTPGSNVAMLQNVILPNGTMWTFLYNSSGDLASVTFPTGGTISYEWASFNFCSGSSRALTSRTVTDDSGPHVWHYNWTPGTWTNFTPLPTTVVVTDPALNDSVHVSTAMAGCNYYETHAEYYQGSGATRTLLKQVDTSYATFSNPAAEYTHAAGGASFPTTITTTWANSQVTKEQIDYDTPATYTTWDYLCYNCSTTPEAITQTRINGQVAADSVFDYGAGAAGPLLRKTATSYLTLDDPASIVAYDGSGNKCAQTDFTYDDAARLVPSNISQSHVAPYAGAVRANPSSVTRWLTTTPCAANAAWSPITTYTNYFDTGEIASSTDALNNVTQYSYAPIFYGAYLTQTRFPDTVTSGATFNHILNGDYDFNTGMLRTYTDQNGNSSAYLFDSMRRITNAGFPDGGQVQFNYPNPQTVEKRQLQNSQAGAWIDQFVNFDGYGRQVKTQLASDPSGTTYQVTAYDSLGRESQVFNPTRCNPPGTSCGEATWGYTTYGYDALGRTTSVTSQDGGVSTSTFNGNAVTVSDQAGKKRKTVSDALGRVTKVFEDPDGLNYETDYQYDALGNLLRVDQKGSAPSDSSKWRTRQFTYDSFSRLLTASNPESGNITYAYDANGNVLSRTDARGIITTYSYDPLNRILGKSYSDGTLGAGYVYDQAGVWGPAETNTVGRLVLVSNGHFVADGRFAATLFSYDPMGRINAQWDCAPSTYNVGCPSVSALYDSAGDLTQLTYPNGQVVRFAFNTAGRATSAKDQASNINFAQSASYGPDGSLTGFLGGQRTGFSGFTSLFTYNNRLQPCRMTASTAALPANCADTDPTHAGNVLDIAYDFHLGSGNNGDVYGILNNRDHTRDQSFAYDALNRLTSAQNAGSDCGFKAVNNSNQTIYWGNTYGYDAWGNLQNKTVTKCAAEYLSAPALPNNRLTGYSYDAAGNMTNDGLGHSLVFDAENRIASANSGALQYAYDHALGRVRKDVSGQPTTEYYYFGGNVLAEKNISTGYWTNYIFFAGDRIARREFPAGDVFYYFSDYLNTTSVVRDSAGNPRAESDYYPWGGEIKFVDNDSNRYKFTGKERDQETQLDYFGARYYSNGLGRFVGADYSSTPVPVPYAEFTDPQTLNQYSYVRNLPTVKTDLDGHGDAMLKYNQCQASAACRAADEKDLKEHPFLHVAGPVLIGGAEAAVVFVPAIIIDLIAAAESQSNNNATPIPQPGQQPTAPGAPRLPQDQNVNPVPPPANNGNGTVGPSANQNAAAQADAANAAGNSHTDIRMNQQQVDANGNRVGINRPDLQSTDANGVRHYTEYDRSAQSAADHTARTQANDPNGVTKTKIIK